MASSVTTTQAPDASDLSCAHSCTLTYITDRLCQCFYGCGDDETCCDDFSDHCDGMAGVEEQEREALAQVAAFTVFFSIIMFTVVALIFVNACFKLYRFNKNYGQHSGFDHHNFILRDTPFMLVVTYSGMGSYVLGLFCYLVSNAALGIHYNSDNDVYGNAQISAITFWFLGHTLFYALFILKLYNFVNKTSYQMSARRQFAWLCVLCSFWLASVIVMIIWIDEFHSSYHYGGGLDTQKMVTCMVITFAAHVWFCMLTVFLFATTLFNVTKAKGTSLIEQGGGTSSSRSKAVTVLIEGYMTRICVLCIVPMVFTVFCLLNWMALVGVDAHISHGFVRFCWWLFPINMVLAFMCLFLGLNFDPNMDGSYHLLCGCAHKLCQFFYLRLITNQNSYGQCGDEAHDDGLKGASEDGANFDSEEDDRSHDDESSSETRDGGAVQTLAANITNATALDVGE